MATARTAAHQTGRWRLATAALWLVLAAPSASLADEPPGPRPGLAAAPVESDRLVLEEEWASDLVDLLALDHALPDAPVAADYFSLLCAEQVEREVGTGGHTAPVGPLFEASADVPPPRRSGDPARVVLTVPATALYSLTVEGVGKQRWVIDQKPVGHLDPTHLGVAWSAATTALRAGPHEITGYFGPGARAERIALTALRSLCIAPADGWHAQRPVTYGAKARTLVRTFGFEWRLPEDGDPIEIEGEAFETVSGGGGRTNRRVAVAASRNVWATASKSPAELSYRLHLEDPAVVTIEARVLGDSPQLWSIDGRYRAMVLPTGGPDVFTWTPVLTVPLGAGDHELRARIAHHAGVDLLRFTPRRSSDADYLSVLRELGLHASAADSFVTHSDAIDSLSSPVFFELAARFRQRIEGDPTERPIVLVDEDPEPRSVDRALSPMLPAEL
ncbi:MAG TPA: hypothetical protein VII72_17380 [Myxococcota bacterium]